MEEGIVPSSSSVFFKFDAFDAPSSLGEDSLTASNFKDRLSDDGPRDFDGVSERSLVRSGFGDGDEEPVGVHVPEVRRRGIGDDSFDEGNEIFVS